MKDDRLGYLNLHSISKLHCSLPPLKMFFTEFTFLMKAAHGLTAHTPAGLPDWRFSFVILISVH